MFAKISITSQRLAVIFKFHSQRETVSEEALGREVFRKVGPNSILQDDTVTEVVVGEDMGVERGVDLGFHSEVAIEALPVANCQLSIFHNFEVLVQLNPDLAPVVEIGARRQGRVVEGEIGWRAIGLVAC